MAKRKKVPKKKVAVNRFALIETALKKMTKAELVELLKLTAKEHDEACRYLESKLSIEKPLDLLLTDISDAIAIVQRILTNAG